MTRTLNRGGDRILWTGEDSKARPKRIKWRLLIFFSAFVLLFIGGSLFYVWSRIQVLQLGYEISNALKEERSLIEANKKLRVEIATLKSYGRIEKLATEELRMAKPKPEQIIVIR
ncbi:MAG: cell division protein FtsL [Syntrophaceae bacterium]|nr:cell division protein FtsL [Syntrophaceae bacterium]